MACLKSTHQGMDVGTEPGDQCPCWSWLCPVGVLSSLDLVLEDWDSWVSLTGPGPAFPSVPRHRPPLTLPARVPVLQGTSRLSLTLLLDLLLCLPPLLQPPPPQVQRGPAAPIPGPAGSHLSPGPLGHGPVAPAEENSGKGDVHPEDGHCHQGSDEQGGGWGDSSVSILGEEWGAGGWRAETLLQGAQ